MVEDVESLDSLSEILTAISENPYDISLHAKHIQLALKYGQEDQANEARRLMTMFWAASDDVWLPLMEHRLQQGQDTVQDALEIHELLQRAENDYLCTSILIDSLVLF